MLGARARALGAAPNKREHIIGGQSGKLVEKLPLALALVSALAKLEQI